MTSDRITVVSRIGRDKVGSPLSFPLSAWERARNYPTFNALYNRRQLVRSRWTEEDYERAPEQAERIIDSQVRAIETALRKMERAREE